MSEDRFCPGCKKKRASTSFEGLPLELRCNHCVDSDKMLQIKDLNIDLAGKKLGQVLDAAGKGMSLPPLETAVAGLYDVWGGPRGLFKDFYDWTQACAASKKYSAAINAVVNILKLHAKVDRMKMEDDWKSMTDEQVRDKLKQKVSALIAEISVEDAKGEFRKKLEGGDDPCGTTSQN